MKIYTSNFASLAKIKKMNLTPVGIAIFSPRYYTGKNYKKLAPRKEMIHMEEVKYIPLFDKILNNLDISMVMQELNDISNNCDIVLLCYEKPGEFCHRRLVAKWIEENTKIKVTELIFTKKTPTLF